MSKRKDNPQKSAMRELIREYLTSNYRYSAKDSDDNRFVFIKE